MLQPFLIIFSISISLTVEAFSVERINEINNWLHQLSQSWTGFSSQITWIQHFIEQIGVIPKKIIPILLSWAGFSLFYFLLPNTKVKFKHALFGGFAAMFLLELSKPIFSLYLHNIAEESLVKKFYGVLSFVPLTLLWVYIIWVIVLIGAEVAFAFQNIKAYILDKYWSCYSPLQKSFITIQMLMQIVSQSRLDNDGLEYAEVKIPFNIPAENVHDCFDALLKSKFNKSTMENILEIDPESVFELNDAYEVYKNMYVSDIDANLPKNQEEYHRLQTEFDLIVDKISNESGNKTA